MSKVSMHRRYVCQRLAAGGAALFTGSRCLPVHAGTTTRASQLHQKRIPSTGELMPSIGMGTWLTFDVPAEGPALEQRIRVLKAFFEAGGGMIDSSPMYGHAEQVVGRCLERLEDTTTLFSASKIWTPIDLMGQAQMANTETLWGVGTIDLMYVHNLLAWSLHLPELREWKASGRIRYLGFTTSHGRRHAELADLLDEEPVDVVQLTYNMADREAERRLLPMARDRGIAVVVNRPFQGGALVDRLSRLPLPGIGQSLGCSHWAQYLLLYIVSHPAVTCAIPATRRVDHMRQNMAALTLELPDARTRREMLAAVHAVL